MKSSYGDMGELIPTNFGKCGMKDLVDKRRKGKATTNNLVFSPSNVNSYVVVVH